MQVSETRRRLEESQKETQRVSGDLTATRLSLHTAQEKASLLRKQFELRSQELVSSKREAANILRYMYTEGGIVMGRGLEN